MRAKSVKNNGGRKWHKLRQWWQIAGISGKPAIVVFSSDAMSDADFKKNSSGLPASFAQGRKRSQK
jgi:hypothetical protein